MAKMKRQLTLLGDFTKVKAKKISKKTHVANTNVSLEGKMRFLISVKIIIDTKKVNRFFPG